MMGNDPVKNRRLREETTMSYVPHPRYAIILDRAMRVSLAVEELLDGLWTRGRFTNMLEDRVCSAAREVYDCLYAQANGEHADAARCWEVLQGIVEYEVPMLLYHPTKGLKRSRSREKAAREALPIARMQLPHLRKMVDDRYTRKARDVLDKISRKKQSICPKRPPARLVDHQIHELFRWIEEVIDLALHHYEMRRIWVRGKARRKKVSE